ncbi:HAD hydrolase-like protein [Conexibacter woesei]|uniref:HAD hydrolase-like protein n=1 Tax=Conexibacter woesei TaxID=191495 RepID=UPI00041AE5BC|nr:HAD hydrolase-like protein [Conexibacter woesei]
MSAAVLFDLDGCLVDSRRGITTSLRHALAAAGLPDRDPADLERFIGPPMSHTMQELTGAVAGTAENDALVAGYRAHYAQTLVAGTEVFAGIPEALADLRAAGHPLAVATSKPLPFARQLLDELGLGPAFGHVAAAPLSSHEPSKAELVAEALAALGTERGVMVGDRRFDVEGGLANGAATIGVLWGFGSREELEAAGASALAAAPAELPGLVAALLDDAQAG